MGSQLCFATVRPLQCSLVLQESASPSCLPPTRSPCCAPWLLAGNLLSHGLTVLAARAIVGCARMRPSDVAALRAVSRQHAAEELVERAQDAALQRREQEKRFAASRRISAVEVTDVRTATAYPPVTSGGVLGLDASLSLEHGERRTRCVVACDCHVSLWVRGVVNPPRAHSTLGAR